MLFDLFDVGVAFAAASGTVVLAVDFWGVFEVGLGVGFFFFFDDGVLLGVFVDGYLVV